MSIVNLISLYFGDLSCHCLLLYDDATLSVCAVNAGLDTVMQQ